MAEPHPGQLHSQAAPLLADEKQRSEGLRLTIRAALRQRATPLALAASEELIGRPDSDVADHALRARALLGACRFRDVLAVAKRFPERGGVAAAAAIAHVMLGKAEAATATARRALAMNDIDEADARRTAWLARYAASLAGAGEKAGVFARWSASPEVERDATIFALLDYRSPDIDRNSLNIGDWMQTLAAMRHLARLDGVDWTFDEPQLAPLMARLQATWAKGERIACRGRAHLAIIDRDFPLSATLRFPDRTVWSIANGWYAHLVFGETHAWPAPKGFEPILTSVHIAKPADLSAERIAWLKAHAPIGCRDLSTVEWLRNQGVRAYFSGCLTTTLRTSPQARGDERLLVDVAEAEGDWIRISHHDPALRGASFSTIMTRAADLLDRYAACAAVTTSRLHCALPARAVGAAAEFLPPKPADRRFEGLINIDDAAFTAMSGWLTTLLGEILPMILSGAAPKDVRKVIARVTKAPVAKAPTKRAEKATSGALPDSVTLAIAFDRNYAPYAQVVLASVRANTRASLRILALVRGLSTEEAEAVASVAKPIETRVFAMDGRLEGTSIALAGPTTISTMDRLYLPELAPDLDRVVYVDCDTMVFADIAELAALDPGETGLAGRPTPNPQIANLVDAIEKRAVQLEPSRARDLRAWMAAHADLAGPYCNTGSLVLSLAALRRNGIAKLAISLAETYGVHDQDALNLAARGRATILPDDWNLLPDHDLCATPKLIHWAGAKKPWKAAAVRFQPDWRALAMSLPALPLAAPAPAPEPAADAAPQSLPANHWREASSYLHTWDRRAEMAATWLPKQGRIADIGCGAPMSLRRFLAPECVYAPADLKAWTDEVAEIDLDAGQFPKGAFDAVAMLGVLEYLQKPGAALRRARRAADWLVTSYCHPVGPRAAELRAKRGWINAFREQPFEDLLKRQGWTIEKTALFVENAQMRQMLYLCRG